MLFCTVEKGLLARTWRMLCIEHLRMYKWNRKTKSNWIESKICIVEVLCICAKVITEIFQYNEYRLSGSSFTHALPSTSDSASFCADEWAACRVQCGEQGLLWSREVQWRLALFAGGGEDLHEPGRVHILGCLPPHTSFQQDSGQTDVPGASVRRLSHERATALHASTMTLVSSELYLQCTPSTQTFT